MTPSLRPSLTPRNGQRLRVLGIARISTEHQDVRSLADQEALYRHWLDQNHGLPYDLTMIAGRGSGESLVRAEVQQASDAIETGTYDLVIAEDLGRIFRRIHAQLFCELCEDFGTRLIAINDQIDTSQENWRVLAGFASLRHEMYNADTGKRIRRSLRNRFSQGGVVQFVIYGYVKPPGAKTDTDLQKDPAAEPVIAEMIRRLEDGASYSEVADLLNDQGVKPGPCARSSRWTCSLVKYFIHNPILKGVRIRNRRVARRVNQTGLRKSVAAPPEELLTRDCPHLAFVDPVRYDRLIAMLDQRNAIFRRKGVNGIDTRKNVPKKRTVWPGQHVDCGICGRMFVYGGHGQTDHLICRGAVEYRCWNAITMDGPLARKKMIAAIHEVIEGLPDFEAGMLEMVQEEVRQQEAGRGKQLEGLQQKQLRLEREGDNLMRAIREGGPPGVLLEELQRLELEKTEVAWELSQVRENAKMSVALPSLPEIKALAGQAMVSLSETSLEFGRLLRQWIPRITVYPYRLCDGGHPVLRARFTVSLAALVPGLFQEAMGPMLQRELEVDLFEPPQREQVRHEVVRLTGDGMSQKKIARCLGIAFPAVQRAMALQRKMHFEGLSDAYVPVVKPPDDYTKLRRHRHGRYRFEPLTEASPE